MSNSIYFVTLRGYLKVSRRNHPARHFECIIGRIGHNTLTHHWHYDYQLHCFTEHGPTFMGAIFLSEDGLSRVIPRWIRLSLSSISRTGIEGSTGVPWPSKPHLNAWESDFTTKTTANASDIHRGNERWREGEFWAKDDPLTLWYNDSSPYAKRRRESKQKVAVI